MTIRSMINRIAAKFAAFSSNPNRIDRILESVVDIRYRVDSILESVVDIRDLCIELAARDREMNHANPLVRFGRKCFSQADEDGITIEIVKRLGINNGYFLEFGVGDGTENNTLALLACGWKGAWVGGQDLAFDVTSSMRLSFEKCWVTKDNILATLSKCIEKCDRDQIDLISMDLDGNDYHFCKELLINGVRPRVFIVEYNAKFFPPIEFVIDYDQEHVWQDDDYFGASLTSYCSLFHQFGYELVCCNAATGANAFFVLRDLSNLFNDVPRDIEKLYSAPAYYLPSKYGHKASISTIKTVIR